MQVEECLHRDNQKGSLKPKWTKQRKTEAGHRGRRHCQSYQPIVSTAEKEVHEEGTFSAQRGLWKLMEGKLNEVTNDTYDDADSFQQS